MIKKNFIFTFHFPFFTTCLRNIISLVIYMFNNTVVSNSQVKNSSINIPGKSEVTFGIILFSLMMVIKQNSIIAVGKSTF